MSEENPLTTGNSALTRDSITYLLPQREIRRQFLLNTMQSKSLLLPLAISFLSLVYLVLYSPLLGGSFASGLVALVAGIFWAASLIWRFGFRYQQGYTQKLQELAFQFEAESAIQIDAQLQQAQSSIEEGFQATGTSEGLNISRRLAHEYRELQRVMANEAEADLLSSSNLHALVRETYVQGLNVLEHALELHRAIGDSRESQLEDDIHRLEQKVAAITENGCTGENLQLILEKIHFNKERLARAEKLRMRVEELLHQADRCEASLSRTRIELAELKADASDVRVLSVVDTLQKTIERAKEVQAELKKQGY